MKNVVFLCLAILVVGCSTKEDDYSNKTQQEVWINGYTTTSSSEYADKQTNIIRFLFFDPDKASTFDGKHLILVLILITNIPSYKKILYIPC